MDSRESRASGSVGSSTRTSPSPLQHVKGASHGCDRRRLDHSEGAKAALRFALEEARLRQATLRVVHAWQFGYIGATGLEGWLPAVGGELEDFRKGAAAALDETLRDVGADKDGVAIERRVDQRSEEHTSE